MSAVHGFVAAGWALLVRLLRRVCRVSSWVPPRSGACSIVSVSLLLHFSLLSTIASCRRAQSCSCMLLFMQGEDGKKAWETSFANIYGPLLDLPPASVLETDTNTFIKLFKAKGLMGPPSGNAMLGFGRRSVAGRWTSTAAFGGNMSHLPTDAIWPKHTPSPAGGLGTPGHATGRGSVSPPDGRRRQAPDPHALRGVWSVLVRACAVCARERAPACSGEGQTFCRHSFPSPLCTQGRICSTTKRQAHRNTLPPDIPLLAIERRRSEALLPLHLKHRRPESVCPCQWKAQK